MADSGSRVAAAAGSLGSVLSSLGGFFPVEFHRSGSAPVAPWLRLDELVTDRGAFAERVDAVGALLRGGPVDSTLGPTPLMVTRVAASVTQLNLSARLLAPALAVAVLTDSLLDLELAGLWWQPVLGGPVPLSVPDFGTPRPVSGTGDLAGELDRWLLGGPIAVMIERAATFGVSRRVLWGNVASALHGVIDQLCLYAPTVTGRATAVEAALLRGGALFGSTTRTGTGRFRRRSCCLIYRMAGSSARSVVCGDCVLNAD